MKWLAIVLSILFLTQCKTMPPPIDDYTLARAAIDSARIVQAGRYSPGFWNEAEDAYNLAVVAYNDHEYAKAKALFVKARLAAEKAENSARFIRQKNGEVL